MSQEDARRGWHTSGRYIGRQLAKFCGWEFSRATMRHAFARAVALMKEGRQEDTHITFSVYAHIIRETHEAGECTLHGSDELAAKA